jgi:hypothetical protein
MRTTVVAVVLACSVGTASGAYLVDLGGGDRLTVDSYWEDGDRTHLVRGGVDMIVPKRRVRSIHEAEGTSFAAAPATRGVSQSAGRASREDLQAQQQGLMKHFFRIQREKFEAENRGDPPQKLRRLTREYERTNRRRQELQRELERAQAAE